MQPIHLAIGIVEGIVTAALVAFVWQARPEILGFGVEAGARRPGLKPVLVTLGVVAAIAAGLLSWFASSHPDGLEWSMSRTAGKEELGSPPGVHQSLAEVQKKTAFLPDYGLPEPESPAAEAPEQGEAASEAGAESAEPWPAVSGGTSLAGLVGSAMVLALAGIVGLAVRFGRRKPQV
jgi:cobalt/nickel transport system permease protein